MKNALSQMIYVNFKELLHNLSITSVGITSLTLLGKLYAMSEKSSGIV